MDDQGLLLPIVGAVCLGILAVFTIPACRQAWSRPRLSLSPRGDYEAIPELYESEDGQATEESVRRFSDREARVAACIALAIGTGASIASAVFARRDDARLRHAQPYGWYMFNNWADVPAWALVCGQFASIPSRSHYDTRFMLAGFGLLSSITLLVSIAVRFGFDIVVALGEGSDSRALRLGVGRLMELLAAIFAFLAFGSFPHRPDVYDKGHLVDQQHAVSVLTRFGFTWNRLIFEIPKERQLELEDIPNMNGATRSRNVNPRFLAEGRKGRLWWQLISSFKYTLALQWLLTLVSSLLSLFPQYVLYNFIERLESPQMSRGKDPRLWGWVAALSTSLLLQIWVSARQRWLTTSRLEAPAQSLLQTLVFQKALRLDEAAEPGQKTVGDKSKDPDKEAPPAASKADKKAGGGDIRQSIVNHMKLDTGRMIIFCTYNYWFPLALFKLFFAGTFLVRLIGWKAFLAGFCSASAILPISHKLSKRYAAIQFSLMKYRDGKTHVLTEALQGMRQLKYSALEQVYEKKILQSRNEELAQYWRVSKWSCLLGLIINVGPLMLSCVSLTVYAYTVETHVRASVIFASLGLFDQLDEAFAYLPLIQVYMMEAWTSCCRLEKYLNQPDRAPVSTPGDTIRFDDATVRWPRVEDSDEAMPPVGEEEENRSILRDVTLDFPSGELTIISGKTGAGKSLLLAAILGEVKLLSGGIQVPVAPPVAVIEAEDVSDADWVLPSLTSFVSQTPWVESGSVKQNITFGMPFRAGRYAKVLQACALDKDMELLVDGDETEVGPKGVTLSGGQRWRIALARALYSRAGILILDDVLSAVDAHVGRVIVDEALTGDLAKGRTRILATHHAEMCLPRASYHVRLAGGRMEGTEEISPEDVAVASGSGGEPSSTAASLSEDTAVERPDGTTEQDGKKKHSSKVEEETRETGRVKMRVYIAYIRAGRKYFFWLLALVLLLASRATSFARTWSLKELSESYTTEGISSSLYARPSAQVQMGGPVLQAEAAYQRSVGFWLAAFVACSFGAVFLMVALGLTFVIIGLGTSRVMFERMTHAILRAPLRWIDTIPTGRILNRFTSDTFIVDRRLASELGSLMSNIFNMVLVIGTSVTVSPYILIFGFILLSLYGLIARTYIGAAREVKRINSVCQSPIYDQFSTVLSGLSTIRAFHRTDFYTQRMFQMIDNGAKTTWALQLLSRWMGFRMGLLGALFVTAVAAAVTLGSVDAALAGFGLVFSLRYTAALSSLLGNMTSIELGFNAAERVLEYSEIKTEPEGGDDAPAAWPSRGEIDVENLTVGYGDDLPAVLKDLSFEVRAGERVGVVGRTGAGKSTLAAVFFRLLEARQGSIHIDGIDISKLKLTQLRSRLAIIPQDPFLFSGTLRSNLDMEGTMDDYDLQQVLQRVHLVEPQTGDPGRPTRYPPVDDVVAAAERPQATDDILAETDRDPAPTGAVTATGPALDPIPLAMNAAVEDTTAEPNTTATPEDGAAEPHAASATETETANAFTNLSTPISTGGANLSQGQRQLVCLARALLARPKIVVLDEATSAVDRGTDGAIQESLREVFASGGCTVLVIAHRLSTVADFDRLLVLKEGRVAEMGTPAELLRAGMKLDKQREEPTVADGDGAEASDSGAGAFWELVQRSAEKEKLVEMILGEGEVS